MIRRIVQSAVCSVRVFHIDFLLCSSQLLLWNMLYNITIIQYYSHTNYITFCTSYESRLAPIMLLKLFLEFPKFFTHFLNLFPYHHLLFPYYSFNFHCSFNFCCVNDNNEAISLYKPSKIKFTLDNWNSRARTGCPSWIYITSMHAYTLKSSIIFFKICITAFMFTIIIISY